jgi:hypothetical protein
VGLGGVVLGLGVGEADGLLGELVGVGEGSPVGIGVGVADGVGDGAMLE